MGHETLYAYEHPRPSITVDLVVISDLGRDAKMLLVERKNKPYKGRLALPGGFVNMDELTKDAALRELKEETGVVFDPSKVYYLDFFEGVDRDPRGRVVSFAYSVVANGTPTPVAGDDAATAAWYPVSTTGLAFDHDNIVQAALFKFGFNAYRDWPWPQ